MPSEYRERPYLQGPAVRVARRRDDGQVAPGHAVHARHRRSGLRDRRVGQTVGGTAQPGGVRAGPRRRPRCRSARSGLSVRACHVQGLFNFVVMIASPATHGRVEHATFRSPKFYVYLFSIYLSLFFSSFLSLVLFLTLSFVCARYRSLRECNTFASRAPPGITEI